MVSSYLITGAYQEGDILQQNVSVSSPPSSIQDILSGQNFDFKNFTNKNLIILAVLILGGILYFKK